MTKTKKAYVRKVDLYICYDGMPSFGGGMDKKIEKVVGCECCGSGYGGVRDMHFRVPQNKLRGIKAKIKKTWKSGKVWVE